MYIPLTRVAINDYIMTFVDSESTCKQINHSHAQACILLGKLVG